MLFREITAAYSQTHAEPIITLCEEDAELLNTKAAGTYSYHYVLKS
jgi:hypothetical protein